MDVIDGLPVIEAVNDGLGVDSDDMDADGQIS
jgi:hypothetical protein